jgi:serine/threonine-protein kinase
MGVEQDDPRDDARAQEIEAESLAESAESAVEQVSSGISPRAVPSLSRDLVPGTVINGKYRVESMIGRGAMGVVAECRHIELGERVALKFLIASSAPRHEDLGVRFLREAQMSARLKNEHIARVVDVGVWEGSAPYMVMEYLEGRLAPERAIDYAIQVCEGVAEAHARGIVHRDLKPSNLFVTQRPDGSDLIKILDFGISKWNVPEDDPGEATETGIILGSPKYMSPEQVFASSKVDARSDVWSLGAIVYEMLVGRPPFDHPTFAQTCAELSTDRKPPSICAQLPEATPALEAAIFACFERNVERRTQTVADLAAQLLEAVGSPFAGVVRARIEATLAARSGRDSLQRPDSVPRVVVRPFSSGVTSLTGTGRSLGPDGTLGSASHRSRSLVVEEPAPTPRKRRGLVAVAALAACLVGGLAALSLDGTATKPAPSPEPSAASVAGVAGEPTPPTAASPTPPEAAVPIAPAGSAPESASDAPVEARPRLRVPIARPRLAGASPTAPAAPAPAAKPAEAPKKNCDPPYTLSADGIKSYKPECF